MYGTCSDYEKILKQGKKVKGQELVIILIAIKTS